MKKNSKKITVLFVDQAVAFGGSLIVVGHIIAAMDKNIYNSVVVAEINKSLLKNHIGSDARVFVIRRPYNYMDWVKTLRLISKIPGKYSKKIIIYLLSGVRSLINLVYVFALVRVIIKEKIDLVHVNNGMNNLAPILISILLKKKFVVHYHGVENLGRMQKLIINKVPKYIIISKYLRQRLISSHIPEDRMVVIPNPCMIKDVEPIDIQRLCKKYNINDNDLIIGIVGRIIRWKGHVEFLKAVYLVLGLIPDAKVLIIGDMSDGDLEYADYILKNVNDSGFKDRIIFTGYTSDVSVYYQIMHVCVHCSIEPEPFGLVITEAMSNGVPVIASNLGAPLEIIEDGVTGFVIDPTDSVKLANCIRELLSDKELRHRISVKAKEYVIESHDLKEYGKAIENVYAEVLFSK